MRSCTRSHVLSRGRGFKSHNQILDGEKISLICLKMHFFEEKRHKKRKRERGEHIVKKCLTYQQEKRRKKKVLQYWSPNP